MGEHAKDLIYGELPRWASPWPCSTGLSFFSFFSSFLSPIKLSNSLVILAKNDMIAFFFYYKCLVQCGMSNYREVKKFGVEIVQRLVKDPSKIPPLRTVPHLPLHELTPLLPVLWYSCCCRLHIQVPESILISSARPPSVDIWCNKHLALLQILEAILYSYTLGWRN